MANYDQMTAAYKAMGNNVRINDVQRPSVFVPQTKHTLTQLLTNAGGSTATHPAFIVGGVEKATIDIGKYQSVFIGGRAYSLPMEPPGHTITGDNIINYSKANGAGFHSITLAEWAFMALWCRKNAFMPKGNNNYGKDASESIYYGIPCTYENDGKTRHILTGSGPLTYAHNNDRGGVWDLNGNVAELVAGYRTVDGEIQIIADNNAALATCDMSLNSAEWKAILPDGTLVAPGTANTLKWRWTGSVWELDTTTVVEDQYHGCSFTSMTVNATNVGAAAPLIVRALALMPDEPGQDYGGDYWFVNTSGERWLRRGGNYNVGSSAGVFYGSGNHVRGHASTFCGARLAYVA